MKTILLVLEGIADEPIEALDRKTPLEIAKTPHLKALSQGGSVGRLRLADSKLVPSKERTSLSLLGYDATAALTARGPLSASAIDLKMADGEWLVACRLVTVADGKLVDAHAGRIGGRETAALYEALNRSFKNHNMRIYTGDGRSHVLVIRSDESQGKLDELDLSGPDEMIGSEQREAWLKNSSGVKLQAALAEAAEMLESHEVNKVRVDLNENPANALWVWGIGKRLRLQPFSVPGSTVVLSSSDIWKGAARAAGIEWAPALTAERPEPADLAELTGQLTGWSRSHNLVILHLDEADLAAIAGEFNKKIRWIEAFDQHLIGGIRERMGKNNDMRIAVVSGHVSATDRRERTSSEAPFLLWGSGVEPAGQPEFTEEAASRGGKGLSGGSELLKKII